MRKFNAKTLFPFLIVLAGCGEDVATIPSVPTGPSPTGPSYSIGGNINGLNGTVVLKTSKGDQLSVASDGSFQFSNQYKAGESYSVSVVNHPLGQRCGVLGSSGTMSSSNINGISVLCDDLGAGAGGTASNTFCFIASDHKAYCSGRNDSGQLGNGTKTNSSIAVAVDVSTLPNGVTFRKLANGGSFSCAIGSDQLAYCWGADSSGQLGDGSSVDQVRPVAVSTSGALAGLTVKSIASGNSFTCLIASDDRLYCWGSNSWGQLGIGSTTTSKVPVAVTGIPGNTVKQLAVGDSHACAVAASDGRIYCWGGNNTPLGDGTSTNSKVPVAVSISGVLSGKTIASISVGSMHACALDTNGSIYCWGTGGWGQIGDGSGSDKSVPVAVSTSGVLNGKTIQSITAGSLSTCAITTEGLAYCWGNRGSGELGDGSTMGYAMTAVAVTSSGVLSGKKVLRTSAVNGNYCATADDEKVYCWGKNSMGMLANGTSMLSAVPTLASSLP